MASHSTLTQQGRGMAQTSTHTGTPPVRRCILCQQSLSLKVAAQNRGTPLRFGRFGVPPDRARPCLPGARPTMPAGARPAGGPNPKRPAARRRRSADGAAPSVIGSPTQADPCLVRHPVFVNRTNLVRVQPWSKLGLNMV